MATQSSAWTRNRPFVRPSTVRCRHVAGIDSNESDMFIRILTLLTILATILLPSADRAHAQAAPSVASRPPSPTGRYYRFGLGVSVLPARLVSPSDDTQGRIVATGGVVLVSAGRRFRCRNALHMDFSVDVGPSPRVTVDGETGSFEDVVFKRYMLGIGMTRFVRDAQGPIITYGAGPAVALLDDDDAYERLVLFAGVGAYASLGAGREWRVRDVHLGLLGLVRAELYRNFDNGEHFRGASMALLFTVSRSQLAD